MNAIVKVNNWLIRRKKYTLASDSILLLCPRCLQNNQCRQRVVVDSDECLRCGRCDVADLVSLKEKYGFRLRFVTGGGEATAAVKSPDVAAVVAVACGKELVLGLIHTGRKPVVALQLKRPEGPCRNTRIDGGEVEESVRFFMGDLP